MIPKGMKVGDTFEDGGVMHKVLALVGENYISEVIDEEVPLKPTEEVVEEKKEEKTDLESLQYAQLKKMCAEKGLDAKGTKADLIARLEG